MALDDGLKENGICTFLKVANFNLQSVLDRFKIKWRALHTMQRSQTVFALRKIILNIKTFTLKLKWLPCNRNIIGCPLTLQKYRQTVRVLRRFSKSWKTVHHALVISTVSLVACERHFRKRVKKSSRSGARGCAFWFPRHLNYFFLLP